MKSNSRTIVQLADYGGPYSGNFISSLKILDARLSQIGWRQILILSDIAEDRDWFKELIKLKYRIYLLPRSRSKIEIGRDIYGIVKKENALILHTHFSTFDMPAVMAKLLGKIDGRNIHLIRHVHSAFPINKTINRWLKDIIKFRCTGNAVHSLYVSNAIMEVDVDRGLNKANGSILPNGIDTGRPGNANQTRRELLNNYQIRETNNNLLLFGWDPVTKGVDIALVACLKLVEVAADFNLILIGEEKLRQYVNDFFSGEIPAWLIILAPDENVSNLYQIADIFISASRYEGFSYSVLEAMVRGLPIVSSDISGLNWAREAPKVDFFISENTSDLFNVLVGLINMEQSEKNGIFAENIDFVENNYTVQRWADKLLDIYEKITCHTL